MAENPYKSAETETPPPPGRFRFSPAGVVLSLVAIVIAIAFLLPAQRGTREAPNRAQCLNNVKQIVLALQNYHDKNGTLPPAYTVDDQGNRLHSWRTLILPYLDQQELYDQIDLTRPWDDPVNAEARATVVDVYLCPSAAHEEDCTTYLAVVGPEGAFSGSAGNSFHELRGGIANTVALVDISFRDAIHWMSPEDISLDELLLYNSEARLQHGSRIVVGMLDGRVEVIELDDDLEKFHALLKVQPAPAK